MDKYSGTSNICGGTIQKIRKQLGLTQKELASRLQAEYNIQVDQRAISRMETGIRVIADYELMAISKILGVSLDGIFDDRTCQTQERPHLPHESCCIIVLHTTIK